MKIRWSVILILTVFVSTAGLSNEADAGHWGKGSYFVRKVSKDQMEKVYDQLNLTPQQKQQLEANRNRNHKKIDSIRAKIKQLKQKLNKELEKADLNQEKVDQLQSQLKQYRAQMSDLRLDGIMGVRQILTPEQYRKFNQLTGH